MKKRPLIIGRTPNRKSLPLLLSVMTASFGLGVGSASAQAQESERYTPAQTQQDRDRQQQATTRPQQARPMQARPQQARQDAWRDTRRPAAQQQQQQRETAEGKGAAIIEGQVQGFREVSLRRGQGVPQDHTWVRLRLESGYESIVDLGPEKDLADLDMERGDTIRVTGRHASIGGQNVLIADRIRVGGESINIDRKKSKQEVSGKVRDYSEVNIQDSEFEDYLVVRLRMEDGNEVTTALGKDASLEDFDIEQNVQVKIEGERKVVDGRPILIARKVTIEGETTEIGEDGDVRDQD